MKGRRGLTPEALPAGRRTRDPSPLVMFPSCDREPTRAEVPLRYQLPISVEEDRFQTEGPRGQLPYSPARSQVGTSQSGEGDT